MIFRPSAQLADAAILRRCEGPDDPIDLLAQWRHRLAEYQRHRAHRQSRAESYLSERIARAARAEPG